MKNVKEVIRGTDATGLTFLSKRDSGDIMFKNGTFSFSHPISEIDNSFS